MCLALELHFNSFTANKIISAMFFNSLKHKHLRLCKDKPLHI